ncbi:MAG: sulfatase-like hydrolase/transferase [Burkholderiaceae bacterium]
MATKRRPRPDLIVILIDDLRFDEFGAGGHPYMKTPNIDRIAAEGATFTRAFHPTPICSPNRASIVTGQYASRHGIIDNVARDAMSFRLPNYHLALQALGYETAHVGKWHMGNSAAPRPGYDEWFSFPGHGSLIDPTFDHNGTTVHQTGYMTDLLNAHALEFVSRERDRPYALFLAHKAVHPDAFQAADGTLDLAAFGGYRVPERHAELYRGEHFPPRPNVMTPEQAARGKPAWAESVTLKQQPGSKAVLEAIMSGSQEEIRLRAAMMASVDEGVGQLLDALERSGRLDDTAILFMGDNGFFFGEHGLGPERRFAYEEGIRSPFLLRYPRKVKAGTTIDRLVMSIDVAPTMVALAGGKPAKTIQGASLLPLLRDRKAPWRKSVLCEYYAENAMPWLVGMSYKAVRTDRYKLIHWVNKAGQPGMLDELYDLRNDPYELDNLIRSKSHAQTVHRLRRELGRLVVGSLGL